MKRLLSGLVLCTALLFSSGCNGTGPQRMQELKLFSAELYTQIGLARADLATVEDPDERAKLLRWINQAEAVVGTVNKEIQDAKTPGGLAFGLGETILTAIAAFFPPAALLLPVIRTARRRRASLQTVFHSINVGGGPKNPAAAKEALSENPAAMADFQTFKAANGVNGA